jgi:hypothetical protein
MRPVSTFTQAARKKGHRQPLFQHALIHRQLLTEATQRYVSETLPRFVGVQVNGRLPPDNGTP